MPANTFRAAFEEVATDDLVADWVRDQLKSPRARPDLIREPELRDQAQRFVSLLRDALEEQTTNPEAGSFRALHDFVSEISATRSRQGFTPSETAMFLFSLKQPLFARLGAKFEAQPSALADALWEATLLLDKLGLHATEVHQSTREAVIRQQQAELIELSTPVIDIWDRIVVLPLIGTLDSNRTQYVMETLLERIVETSSEVAIVDITGVATVDTLTAQHLLKTATATRLLGAECIISGLRPQIAQMLVQLGVNLGDIQTKATLAGALKVALERTGRVIAERAS